MSKALSDLGRDQRRLIVLRDLRVRRAAQQSRRLSVIRTAALLRATTGRG